MDIISTDVNNLFTIHCVTTRDRVSTDVLAVRNSDDVDLVERQLGCQPGWAS
jgi:hypothetical protein